MFRYAFERDLLTLAIRIIAHSPQCSKRANLLGIPGSTGVRMITLSDNTNIEEKKRVIRKMKKGKEEKRDDEKIRPRDIFVP